MNKLLANEEFIKILKIFFVWRIGLFLISIFAILMVPLASENFLGGGINIYKKYPIIFSWANFDGEHYLAIARNGYSNLNHSFFPFYPLLIRLFSLSSSNLFFLTIMGLIVSNLFFLAALFIYFKLVLLDFPNKIAILSILLLIIFPTSFYFGALYTESIFLFLSAGSFYFARKQKWLLAGIFGGLSSATRIYGILLLPVLIFEAIVQIKSKQLGFKNIATRILSLFIIPIGLLAYMFFLNQSTGNPVAFYTELSAFGVQRAGEFVLLPQVLFRYIKILITVEPSAHIYFIAFFEILTFIIALFLTIAGFIKKIRTSYLIYSLLGLLLPTLTGSLSSIPRYVAVLFPLFLVGAFLLSKTQKQIQYVVYTVLLCLLIINTALFVRGYWIA